MASEHFRRSKLVRFIQEQRRIISETRTSVEKMGYNPDDYSEPLERLLERLQSDFGIQDSELK